MTETPFTLLYCCFKYIEELYDLNIKLTNSLHPWPFTLPLSVSYSLGLKCEYCGDLEAHIKLCHAQTDQDRHRKTETVGEGCLCK